MLNTLMPIYLKQLYNNCNGFKIALKDFLTSHSFYTLEEYSEYHKNKDSISL
jgi:hypothetical protein